MLSFVTYTRDTRIRDVDYLLEDFEKYIHLLPYLRPKIEGSWKVALFDLSIQNVRDILDNNLSKDYVELTLYLSAEVSGQLQAERPKLFIQKKSAYDKFMDLIADMKVMIEPRAAKELYNRVGVSKDKIPEYLTALAEKAHAGVITYNDVKFTVADERCVYASDVIVDFLTNAKWRWKRYNELLSVLGREYAFYALRKYTERLLEDKNNYLQNKDTKIRVIDKIDAFRINQAYVIFHMTSPSELDICMHMLEDRESMTILFDN